MRYKIKLWALMVFIIMIFFNTLSIPGSAYPQDQIIADHTVVEKYTEIPQEYIDIVKTWLVDIAGESHSSGYRIGMDLLEEMDSRFQVSTFDGTIPAVATSELRLGRHASVGEEDFYTNTIAISTIKNKISSQHDSDNPFDVIGFGWCWDMTWHNSPGGDIDPVYEVHWAGSSVGGPEGDLRWGLDSEDQSLTGNSVCMDTYLNAVIEYMQHCTSNGYVCKAIFTTGPVDGNSNNENGYQREIKHQYIRDFVLESNDRILFDYADILCWSNAGVQNTSSWDGHAYPQIHDDNMIDLDGTYTEDGDHIGERGAIRLAKAMWWMLARLAGWEEGESIPNAPVVTGITPTNDTTPTWSWISGGGGNGIFRYKLDSSDLGSGVTETTALSYTPDSPLNEGAHALYVQERNADGDWSVSGSKTIVIDTIAPSTPTVTGTTLTNDTTPTWSWSPGGGGNGTYRYKLDNSDLSIGAVQTIETTYSPDTAFPDGSTHTLYVQERDNAGNWSNSGSKSITVDAEVTPVVILTDTLQNGVVGQAYNMVLEANVTDVTWTVISGNLPDGVSLTDDTISGIPTMDGDYNFFITATDNSSGATADKSFSITIEQNGSTEISITDAIRGTTVYVSSNAGNISNLQAQNPGNLSAPSDYNFPYGVFKFQVTDLAAGGSATITFDIEDEISEDIIWYWYNPETGIWTDISNDVNLAVDGRKVYITLTDGRAGDSDGVPGQITDPSGPALALSVDPNDDDSTDGSSNGLEDSERENSGGCFIETAGE